MGEKILTTLAAAIVLSTPPPGPAGTISHGRFSSPAASCTSSVPCSKAAQQSRTVLDTEGPVTEGVQIRLEVQAEPFLQGSPMPLVFHEKNVGAPVVNAGVDRRHWEQNFRVHVTAKDGSLIPTRSRAGRSSWVEDRLALGEEHMEIGNLSDLYPLAPGEYYVTASTDIRRVADNGSVESGWLATTSDSEATVEWKSAKSNQVEITVVGRPDSAFAVAGLRLSFLEGQSLYHPNDYPSFTMRLTNDNSHAIQISRNQGELWFRDLLLDLKTVAGTTVQWRRGEYGSEVSIANDCPALHESQAYTGSIEPGQSFDLCIRLKQLYQTTPGMAYTLSAHLTLQTLGGANQLTSNTLTFAIAGK